VETLVCRLLPDAVADGPSNMAADEVLLESAVGGQASLRFYGWSAATLSLGYFQPARLRRTDPRLETLPYVRRPTGGVTLVHHHELTYALALPAGPPWQARGEKVAVWLSRVHGIIASALRDLGVCAQLSEGSNETFTGALCFKHVTAGDLVLGAEKVVGSAQRRQHGAVLQHGAILLATSLHTPILPGIEELSGRHLRREEIQQAIVRRWTRDSGWILVAGDWKPEERRRTMELTDQKYTRGSWNAKR
jgi:lipoate-protein ligase A